jgi:hypothetical protein
VRGKKIDAGRLPDAAVPLSAAGSAATATLLFAAAAHPHCAPFFLSLQVSLPPVAATAPVTTTRRRHRKPPPPVTATAGLGELLGSPAAGAIFFTAIFIIYV